MRQCVRMRQMRQQVAAMQGSREDEGGAYIRDGEEGTSTVATEVPVDGIARVGGGVLVDLGGSLGDGDSLNCGLDVVGVVRVQLLAGLQCPR